MESQKKFMRAWNAAGQREHKKNMQKKIMAERDALRFELSMKERSLRKKQIVSAEAARDVEVGLATFEKTLRRFGTDSGNTSTHDRDLSATAQSDVSNFMKSLHDRKSVSDEARRERERRRRKLFVEQQVAAEAAARNRDEERLLAVLMRASRDEARLAEEYVGCFEY